MALTFDLRPAQCGQASSTAQSCADASLARGQPVTGRERHARYGSATGQDLGQDLGRGSGRSGLAIVRVGLTLICLLAAALLAPSVRAHEVQALVGDVTLAPGQVEIGLSGNLEAMIAGIGAEHEDTDDAPEAAEYERLRRLEPEALRAALEAFAPRLREALVVEGFEAAPGTDDATILAGGGRSVPLDLADAEIGPVGDLDLARSSALTLTAPLPPGTTAVTVRLDPALGDLIVRGTGENAEYGEYLQAGTTSVPIAVLGATPRGAWDVFVQYIGVGFEHILPLGLDHILFVIGLFLLAPRFRPLLWQVSAFTLAHTVTLALGALDIVRVPGHIVEPLIALSIVYVCVENIAARGMTRWRPLLIFAFGLLHGLGFASVFEEYGIPEGQFLPALAAFNIGVEIGQLTVIAACFLAVGLWFRDRSWYRAAVTVPGSIVIGLIGLYWSVTRTGLVPEFLPFL